MCCLPACPRRIARFLVAGVAVDASVGGGPPPAACRAGLPLSGGSPVLLQESSRVVRGGGLSAVAGDGLLPPLVPPNPEPAQPPAFSVLSPAAVQQKTAAAGAAPDAQAVWAMRPSPSSPLLPRRGSHRPRPDAAASAARAGRLASGVLGVAVNASTPVADPEVPSALGAEILRGPWPAPAARRLADSSAAATAAPGGPPLAPYYVVLNTTTSPPPTIEPLANLTSEEEISLKAARAAAARDCILGMWSDWSSCEPVAGDSLKSSVQSRSRVIIQPQQPGGEACDPRNMTEISQCLSRAGAEDLQQELVPTETTEAGVEDKAAP